MEQPFIIIVTGLSGSGKSTALNVIEDAGFFCMDNIPVDLLVKLIEVYDFASMNISRLCIGVDVRAGGASFAQQATWMFPLLRDSMGDFRLIFLEAGSESLLNRFKETRRRHPLSDSHPNLLEAIEGERKMMAPIREMADSIIDTSSMNVHELSSAIKDLIKTENQSRDMIIEVRSFGFKKGVPADADIVMDVRYLPNPYFVPGLKEKTGKDEAVCSYLHSLDSYQEFMDKFKAMVRFILPLCRQEGRAYLTVAIGCTGGRHRSVAVAEEIGAVITDAGFHCLVKHRDLA